MAKQKINSLALGYALAIVSAIVMLVLGIFGNLGIYMGAVNSMMQMHEFFSLSVLGIIGGIIEAAIVSFILGLLIGYLYNKLA